MQKLLDVENKFNFNMLCKVLRRIRGKVDEKYYEIVG